MSLQFASASYESPSYFVPSSHKSSSVSQDYRSGLVRNLMNTVRRCVDQQAATQVVLNPGFTQVLSWSNSESLSVSSKMTDFDAQISAIERLKSAPANWSMAEVEAPSEEQARVAKIALITIMMVSIPAPKAMLLDSGTIGAYWRRDGLYASIDFDQDGEFPWAIASGDSIQSGVWVQSQPFPQALRAAVCA